MTESEAKHEGHQGVAAVCLEGGHVLPERVFVGAGHQAIVPIEDSQRQVVRVSGHQPHQETVVSGKNVLFSLSIILLLK